MEFKYEMILMDLDNTLLDFDKAQIRALRACLIDFQFQEELSEAQVADFQSINKDLWVKFEQKQISKKEVFRERFSQFLGISDIKILDEVNDGFLHHLALEPELMDGAEELCIDLSKKTKLGIVTNGDHKTQWLRLKQLSIYKYFDFMVVSDDLGVAKPHPDIFMHALEKGGLQEQDTNKVLMVGDNLKADCSGALGVGMDACWLSESDGNPGSVPVTYQISHLSQLAQAITMN